MSKTIKKTMSNPPAPTTKRPSPPPPPPPSPGEKFDKEIQAEMIKSIFPAMLIKSILPTVISARMIGVSIEDIAAALAAYAIYIRTPEGEAEIAKIIKELNDAV